MFVNPNYIVQQQPSERMKPFYQNNFSQQSLITNASVNNPRLQTLTSPFPIYDKKNTDVRSKAYETDKYFDTEFKLDYYRINPDINRQVGIRKNKYCPVIHFDNNGNETIYDNINDSKLIDIIDPDDSELKEQFNPLRTDMTTFDKLYKNDRIIPFYEQNSNLQKSSINITNNTLSNNDRILRTALMNTDKRKRLNSSSSKSRMKLYDKLKTDEMIRTAFSTENMNGMSIVDNSGNSYENIKESFECSNRNEFDEMYIHILESRAISINTYLLKHPSFKHWKHNWEFMKRNLDKTGITFEQLEDTDDDVAYSVDKGKELKFRFRDRKTYIPLSIEAYILSHELAHMSTEELQHTKTFNELMCIIMVAAYMLRYIDLKNYPIITYKSNGQDILSKNSIKEELYDGIDLIIKYSPEYSDFWKNVKNYIMSE